MLYFMPVAGSLGSGFGLGRKKSMKVRLQSDGGVTLVQNSFIDSVMPSANGEYVKLYLYLLRCASSGKDLTVCGIADFFDHTEKDVRRALSFWEKQKVLRLHYDEQGELAGIEFLDGSEGADSADANETERSQNSQGIAVEGTAAANAAEFSNAAGDGCAAGAGCAAGSGNITGTGSVIGAGSDAGISNTADAVFIGAADGVGFGNAADESEIASRGSEESSSASNKVTAFRPAVSRELREKTAGNEELQQIIYIAENYYGRPLTGREQDDMVCFLYQLNFSQDLVEYLLEYCATRGKTSSRYMEKVAGVWYEKGIRTVEEAKEESALYKREYIEIFRSLGLTRNPAPAEIEVMDRWLHTYGFSVDVIKEACTRTIMRTSQPSLNYAESILASWKKSGVSTLQDIRRLDEAHTAKVLQAERAQSAGNDNPSRTSARPAAKRAARGSQNRFNNFEQRSYDFDVIERALIQAETGKEG